MRNRRSLFSSALVTCALASSIVRALASSIAVAAIAISSSACAGDDSPSGASDAGAKSDAGGGGDSGGSDSGASDSGAGNDASGDAGGSDAPVAVNGCSAAQFAASDHTATADARAITFPANGAAESQYVPACMHIKVGQSVKWTGGFDISTGHPLEPFGGDANTPIQTTTTGASVTFAFPSAGTFGFHCSNHPNAMQGAILVTQ